MLGSWSPACLLIILSGSGIIKPGSTFSMQLNAVTSFCAFNDSTSNPYLLFLLLPKLRIALRKLLDPYIGKYLSKIQTTVLSSPSSVSSSERE